MIMWFEELGREAVPLVGGKGANLAEMLKIGIPVPGGFCISTEAYERFLRETEVLDEISPYLRRLSEEPLEKYGELSRSIQRVIEGKEMPKDVGDSIIEYYDELSKRYGIVDLAVGVRSSGVAEDSAEASFAGQFDTFLNVRGKKALLDSVKRCWASLFGTRVLAYWARQGTTPSEVGSIGVVVQKMVNPRSAGVCFTIDPVSGKPKIVIEGNWGVGESIVKGIVVPDKFVVNKDTLNIEERNLSEKKSYIVAKQGETKQEEVPLDKQNEPCLTDEEVRRIAELSQKLELHYGTPQDTEWAVDLDLSFPENVFLVQTRPVTFIPTQRSPTDEMLDRMISIMRRTGSSVG